MLNGLGHQMATERAWRSRNMIRGAYASRMLDNKIKIMKYKYIWVSVSNRHIDCDTNAIRIPPYKDKIYETSIEGTQKRQKRIYIKAETNQSVILRSKLSDLSSTWWLLGFRISLAHLAFAATKHVKKIIEKLIRNSSKSNTWTDSLPIGKSKLHD